VLRPEDQDFEPSFAYGPRGDVWQEHGHYGTYSREWALHLLEAVRANNTSRGETYPMRLVRRTLTQETIVIEDQQMVDP